MSVAATNWAWAQPVGGAEKLVLLALAHRHHTRTGQCNPSVETLALMVKLSERAVQYALRGLEERGLIEPAGSRKGGRAKAVSWCLNGPDIKRKGADLAPFTDRKGCKSQQGFAKRERVQLAAPDREVRSTVGEGSASRAVGFSSQEAAIIPFVRRVG